MVLDPRWKWFYFVKHWSHRPNWIRKAKSSVLALWNDEYLPTVPNSNLDPSFFLLATTIHGLEGRSPNGLTAYYTDFDMPTAMDEYQLYINEARVSPGCFSVDNDPLFWWLHPVQQKHFPTLAKMALDLLSIPAISANTERLFSLAKYTTSQLRNRIEDSTLHVLMCLRNWNRSPLLKHLEMVPAEAEEQAEEQAEEHAEEEEVIMVDEA